MGGIGDFQIKRQYFPLDILLYNISERGAIFMKKLFLIFYLILTFGFTSIIFAEESNDGILIETIDNSEAIQLFENKLLSDSFILSRYGFNTNSTIGTPFSMEYQDEENNKYYLFYFPIINDGRIVSYVEQTILNDGTVSWSVGEWFSDEGDLEQLRDGNVYALISDKNFNKIAISDKRILNLKIDDDYPIDYTAPYTNIKTKVVDITKPLDELNLSELDSLTDEEKEIFENAQASGKTVARLSLSDEKVINKNNRILVPLRDLAEFIGCDVSWNSDTKTAYVSKDNNVISFKINSANYTVNDTVYAIDVPAEIFNGKTYIPLRTVGEALGMNVIYNEKNHTVTLSY